MRPMVASSKHGRGSYAEGAVSGLSGGELGGVLSSVDISGLGWVVEISWTVAAGVWKEGQRNRVADPEKVLLVGSCRRELKVGTVHANELFPPSNRRIQQVVERVDTKDTKGEPSCIP